MSSLNANGQPMPSQDPIARISERLEQTDEQIRGIVAHLDEHLNRLAKLAKPAVDEELRRWLEAVISGCPEALPPTPPL